MIDIKSKNRSILIPEATTLVKLEKKNHIMNKALEELNSQKETCTKERAITVSKAALDATFGITETISSARGPTEYLMVTECKFMKMELCKKENGETINL